MRYINLHFTYLFTYFAKGLEPPIGLTTSHLSPDRWIRFSTSSHWSGNRLSSSAESSSQEHTRGSGNVQHWRSHTMMMMNRKLMLLRTIVTVNFVPVVKTQQRS